MQIRHALALGTVVLLVATAWPVHAQRNNNNNRQQQRNQPQRTQGQQQDIETLVRLVDAVSTGQTPAVTPDVTITWQHNDFVKGQGGDTYIPFTIQVDRGKFTASNIALYVRVVDKKQLAEAAAAAAAPAQGQDQNRERGRDARGQQPPAPPMYAWDNIHFIELPASGKLSRAIQLRPGEYEAFVAVKERAPDKPQPNAPPPRVGLLRKELPVPDFNVAEITTSTVILASAVEPMQQQLAPQEQEANPYVFGPMRIVPNEERRYSRSGELNVIFWIYGATTAASGKPDVQVEYNFHTRQPDGSEKYFNRTAPQQLNAETLPPEFNVAAGHQLPGSLVVPLTSFPPGDYRLEIKVTDKPSGKSVTRDVNFTVLPV